MKPSTCCHASFCAQAGRHPQLTPTFGMYQVAARIQGASVIDVPLQRANDVSWTRSACSPRGPRACKLVFLCSPNNPTANLFGEDDIARDLRRVAGQVRSSSSTRRISSSRGRRASHAGPLFKLWIMRTLSKAYALAGARCGALIAGPEMVGLLQRIIPPYAIAQSTVEAALRALQPTEVEATRRIRQLLEAYAPGSSTNGRRCPADRNRLHVSTRRQFPDDRLRRCPQRILDTAMPPDCSSATSQQPRLDNIAAHHGRAHANKTTVF